MIVKNVNDLLNDLIDYGIDNIVCDYDLWVEIIPLINFLDLCLETSKELLKVYENE